MRKTLCLVLPPNFFRSSSIATKAAVRCGLRKYSSKVEVTKLLIKKPTEQKISIENVTIDKNPIVKINSATTKIELPPSLKYVKTLMDDYKDCVVLTQMGSFYELYFEHASKYGPKLNLTVASKSYAHGNVSFAGFPVGQLSRHLKVLVNDYGYSVVVAQQFAKSGTADNEVNKFFRRVTRIVTPGTFIDEAFENFHDNNFLLSITFPENCMKKLANDDTNLGLCWCDISTGEIFVQQIVLKDLISAVSRIRPKEILLDENLADFSIQNGCWYSELVELKKYFLKYHKLPSSPKTLESFNSLFTETFDLSTEKLLRIQYQSFTQKELAALRNVLTYVSDHLPDFNMNFQLPQRQLATSIMQLDSRTITALELHTTVKNNSKKGSLLTSVRRTVTPIGARTLTQWISGPSLNLEEIKSRQAIVSYFLDNLENSEKIIRIMKSVSDLSRVLQKFSFGQGDANDLVQLLESLKSASKIRDCLFENLDHAENVTKSLIERIASELSFDQALLDDILESLNTEAIIQNRENLMSKLISEADTEITNDDTDYNFIFNHKKHRGLNGLYKELKNCRRQKKKLDELYQEKFVGQLGARNTTLKQKQSGEYAIHVAASTQNMAKIVEFIQNNGNIDGNIFKVIQKSAQTQWLSHKSWGDLAHNIQLVKLKISQEEDHLLKTMKEKVLTKSNDIRKIASQIGCLDVLLSFAVLAKEKNLVCPVVDNSNVLNIQGGRHMVVEEGLLMGSLEKFVDNDCKLSSGDLWIITGPNMGGKSTYLRQNAIIVILAQIGCFVPCKSAHIGLVDKIFSRIGSADDLYNELSTFMVEMIETSFILKGATNRSLAILDEIGRGTSGREGTAIAFATLKYLMKQNSCRTLFATHFGQELLKIVESDEDEFIKQKAKFLQTNIIEINSKNFFYDHKLKDGVCLTSDALKVAKSAGFPKEALGDAQNILSKL